MSPEAVRMIIKFNCHSSFGVYGKHYLLKFISWQAKVLGAGVQIPGLGMFDMM